MRNKGLIFKLLALIIVASILTTVLVACNKEDEWWKDEFETRPTMTPREFIDYIGGFACGVCHPNQNYEQIADANIEWVRFDISNLPYDKDGNLTPGYLGFKERAKSYADRGFKVMAVTPYPEDYIDAGLDPRYEKNWPEIMKMARFYVEDLQGIVSAFQITNEMGVERFTVPLSMEQAADFIGIQAKAMYRYKKDIIVGYNCGGVEGYMQLPVLMQPYDAYIDYVGVDFYLGCFDAATGALGTAMADVFIALVEENCNKPIIVNEFGYIGYGEPKSDSEKLEIVQGFGAEGATLYEAEQYVKDNVKEIIENENFPQSLRDEFEEIAQLDKAKTQEEIDACYAIISSKILNDEYQSHIYCQLDETYVAKGYPHSPEGQANYMNDQIDALLKIPYVCGSIVYCYADSARCYVCGQEECPVETGWGLVDGKGEPKPLYNVIKDKFGKIRFDKEWFEEHKVYEDPEELIEE